jgi:hypothetical protein
MRTPSASEIISLWERGFGRHPVDQALVLLSAACPTLALEQLSSLAIGGRDACLLRLREAIFGPDATSTARCPHCAEALEFTVRTIDLLASPPDQEAPYELVQDGLTLKFRLPDSTDLRAIVSYPDVGAARRQLLYRCVLEASRDGTRIACEALSEQETAQLASHMAQCDPQADITLDLDCAACGWGWSVAFDIAIFLWHEIDALAKRLLGEVHTLAQFYGWSESDILALSSARRNFYLEQAS